MSKIIRINPPLTNEQVAALKSGDRVLISGVIFTGRDAAHKRMFQLLKSGHELPVDLRGQIIYYVGPTPARPGQVIGAAGPTTSGRMDAYAPTLLAYGLKGMMGKGMRSAEVKEAIKQYKGVYFAATGGAGALLAKTIKKAAVVAYPELGPEAIYRLEVEEFPAIVINDCYGNDLYQDGVKQYAELPK